MENKKNDSSSSDPTQAPSKVKPAVSLSTNNVGRDTTAMDSAHTIKESTEKTQPTPKDKKD